MKCLIYLFIAFNAISANAFWEIDPSSSTITFSSIKQSTIAEKHEFTRFSGRIDDTNKLELSIDLASLETNIPIRNSRLNDFFFEVNKFPKAILTADIDPSVFASENSLQRIEVPATLDLHGVKQKVSIALNLIKMDKGQVIASSAGPIFLDINKFNLTDGLNKLRTIAKLDRIEALVPITFFIVLNQNSKSGEEKAGASTK